MSARKGRKAGGRRRPAEGAVARYLRPRLPDGSLGRIVPVEIHPRFSTMAGNVWAHDLFDVSAFRPVSIPPGSSLTIKVIQSDDTDRGWDGLPTKSRRRAAAPSKPRRRAGKAGPIPKQSSKHRRKTRGCTRGSRRA